MQAVHARANWILIGLVISKWLTGVLRRVVFALTRSSLGAWPRGASGR